MHDFEFLAWFHSFMSNTKHTVQQDHVDVTNLMYILNKRYPTLFGVQSNWVINFCDLKFVGFYLYQLSIFIARAA